MVLELKLGVFYCEIQSEDSLFFFCNLIGTVSTCIFVALLSHDRFSIVLSDVTMNRRYGSQSDDEHFVFKVATNVILNKSKKKRFEN